MVPLILVAATEKSLILNPDTALIPYSLFAVFAIANYMYNLLRIKVSIVMMNTFFSIFYLSLRFYTKFGMMPAHQVLPLVGFTLVTYLNAKEINKSKTEIQSFYI